MKNNKVKKTKLPAIAKRQVALASRYYDVDEINRVITLPLHFEKASDLLCTNIDHPKHPVFNEEIIESIKDNMSSFPSGYSVELKLVIDDYEGYQADALLESFNERIESNNYCANTDSKKGWFKALMLVIAGLVIMFVNIRAKDANLYGTGVEAEAFNLIFDSFATLLIWEAGTVLFLSPSDYRIVSHALVKRLSKVVFLDANKKVRAEETKADIKAEWVQMGKANRFGRFMMIICSFLLSVQTLSLGSNFIHNINTNGFASIGILSFVITSAGLAINVLAIIAGFEYYLDKGKLRYLCPVFAIGALLCSLFLLLAAMLVGIENPDTFVQSVAHYIVGVGVAALYGVGHLICFISNCVSRHKEKVKATTQAQAKEVSKVSKEPVKEADKKVAKKSSKKVTKDASQKPTKVANSKSTKATNKKVASATNKPAAKKTANKKTK